MNILSLSPLQFSHYISIASEFLEQYAFTITPSVIERLRAQYSDLDQQSRSIIIDIALHTHKAKQQEWYKELSPWYFTEQTLMQSSEPAFARHVINTLDVKGHRFIESCTGAGMHAFSALQHGASEINTHEVDPFIGYLASVNASFHGYTMHPILQDGALAETSSQDMFWADPSRRKDGLTRKQMTGYYSPELHILIEKAKRSKRGGIKIAPGERIEGEFTREFLGIGRECREQILWFHTEVIDGTATLIDKDKRYQPTTIDAIPTMISFNQIAQSAYILEPHPALIRGALSAYYAESSISVFDRNIAYGISQSRQDADWFTHYHILHCDTFSRKKLQAFIEAHQWNRTTEIKKRGFPMEPDDIRKQLKFTDGDQAGVIILTRVNDEHVMILCKRA